MFRHRLSQIALMYFKSTFTTEDSFFIGIYVLCRRGNVGILLRLRWSAWLKRYRNAEPIIRRRVCSLTSVFLDERTG